eukprot:6489574-Lingulodinium_polyedra.AAC.1
MRHASRHQLLKASMNQYSSETRGGGYAPRQMDYAGRNFAQYPAHGGRGQNDREPLQAHR